MKEDMRLAQIGTVRREKDGVFVEIDPKYREGLAGLEEFSHCHVLWWANADFGFDKRKVLTAELPYAPGRRAGVFACRSPFRPNLVMTTVCPIKAVDAAAGVVSVADIDAMDGSPVIDLKTYYKDCDRVRDPRQPAWLPDWGDWVPSKGIGLEQ
jgi:tRNA-Thr(GGU) m(6)t(6)A37 methyltransferase TsaA